MESGPEPWRGPDAVNASGAGWHWVVVALFAWAILRWSGSHRWRLRMAGRHGGPRLEQLEQTLERRDQEVAQLEARVAELENRLDFTERLLTDRSAADHEADPA